MINTKKVLVLPGWMTGITFYKTDSRDFDICFGTLHERAHSAEYVIGVSLGALVVLRDINHIKGNVILVNPPLPKRSFIAWVLRWLKYVANEGLLLERQRFTYNPIKYSLELINCIKLLSIDFSNVLDALPKEKVTVIRGTNDRFFCDDTAATYVRSKNIRLIEFNGGHNLSEALEKTLNSVIS